MSKFTPLLTTMIAGFGLMAASTALLAQDPAPMVKGTITKIDTEQGKIGLNHEKIPNLDMEPMSMIFKIGDADALKKFKVGDKVKFTAERVNGAIKVTKILK